MNAKSAIGLTVAIAVAASCQSSRSSEMRPVSHATASEAQAAGPATVTTASAPQQPLAARPLVAPGATGTISSKLDDNHNLLLEVKLAHLPPPSNLDPELTTYVVWIRPLSGGSYQNVGQLIMGSDREGELTTSTAFGEVDLIVTAEASPTPREPSIFTVLQGTARREL